MPPPVRPDGSIIGAADLHLHQFANLGFGEKVVWGYSFHPGGIEAALQSCGPTGLCLDDREVSACKVGCNIFSGATCRAKCETLRCTQATAHGHLGLADPVGAFLDETAHFPSGHPEFWGWPNYNTHTHQQVYHRWLYRAFQGGMRLVVMLAVTNQALCQVFGGGTACNDEMRSVSAQLGAAYDLQDYVDWQNDCQINQNGWYRIARSPRQAREIIKSGAMAVVLGAEVDALFGCGKHDEDCEARLDAQIDQYKRWGLRHVFPIHLFDNAFGGAAIYSDIFNAGGIYVDADAPLLRDCGSDYAFRLARPSTLANALLATLRLKQVDPRAYQGYHSHCNALGLTPVGEALVTKLMNAGMIIDVDHMSALARNKTLEIARQRSYPGVVSGHAGFASLYAGDKKHEGQLTEEDARSIIKLGGLLAPIAHHGSVEDLPARGGQAIRHTCGNSAESFGIGFLHAVDIVKKNRLECARAGSVSCAVGIGTDLNGLAGMPAPRFGPYACGGDGEASNDVRVEYHPSSANGALTMSQAGYRQFDINVDGYAHVGMFPDFVEELRKVGVPEESLDYLFRSAEAYVAMWERAAAASKARP